MRNLHDALFFFPALFVLVAFCSTSAQTENEIKFYRDNGIQPLINGSQYGDYAPGVYLIPHDIVIEKGRTMTIFPGTTILFSQNAMLVVNGKLICTGTSEAPVVFRRLDNEQYFEPLDPRLDTRWDGIYLPDSAQCTMENTIISDSKYGIVISGKNVSMILDSVQFLNNKFQNVKIGDRMMKISPGSLINYKYPEQQGVFIPPAKIMTATETIQQKKEEPRQTSYPKLRIGMGILGGVGLAAAVTGFTMYTKYHDSYLETEDSRDKSLSRASAIAAGTGIVMFGVGTTGFVLTFFY